MKSMQGQLLVASPYLRGTPFERSVVLVLEHDSGGARGVILNCPTEEALREQAAQAMEQLGVEGHRVDCGGPLTGPPTTIRCTAARQDVAQNASLSTSRLRTVGRSAVPGPPPQSAELPIRVRIFVGHAGWQSGQLERELQQGRWLTTPATAEHIFREPEDLWLTLLRVISRGVLRLAPGLHSLPDNPLLN